LANTNLTGLYNSLKRNTDNRFYLDLIKLIEFRLETIKNQMIDAVETDELKKLQGRGAELRDMLTSLQRRPVEAQRTGAFDQ
jgi:hypothetical protein